MPGTLGRLDLLPPEDLDNIETSLSSAVSDAMAEIQRKGISGAAPPRGFKGDLPDDLSSLDDEKVGNLLNNLSRWCGYLDVELSKAAALKKESEVHLAKIMARCRLTLKVDEEGKKLTGPDKDDRVEADPRVVEASRREVYHFTLYSVLKGIRDEAQKNWETVSRRITQRGQEVNRMRREVSVAGTPTMGRTFVRRPHGG
jgi:hypothetical protein